MFGIGAHDSNTFAAFPASAETSAQTDVEPLYTVNFNGDSNMAALTAAWDGFGYSSSKAIDPSDDGSSVTLKIQSGKWAAAGAKLEGLYVQNGAYTFVFTVTASDDNEELESVLTTLRDLL